MCSTCDQHRTADAGDTSTRLEEQAVVPPQHFRRAEEPRITGSAATTAETRRRRGPARGGPPRSGPPSRRDSRRPSARAVAGAPVRPGPHRWFAEQLMLVLSGRRPVHALLGHTRGQAFEQLAQLAARTPLRPRGADRRAAMLASVRGMRLDRHVIEASARVSVGGRERALAFRLEAGDDRRWRCAAVECA